MPTSRSTPRHRLSGALVCVLATVLVAGSLVTVAPAAGATSGTWDPRIADLAEEIEQLRGLDFKHTVPVEVLSSKVFDKRYATDSKMSPKERKEWKRSEASLRALGLLESGLDPNELGGAFGERALGFYDPHTQRIVVRGNKLSDPATRAVLAHELTHVLQDQYFNLAKINRQADKEESSVVRALVEGDATRIGDAYEAKMSEADQAEADEKNRAGNGSATPLPPIYEVTVAGSYELGSVMVALLKAFGGQGAIDDALKHPPVEDIVLIDPSALLDAPKWTDVAAPAAAAGETQLGKSFPLGAWGLYLQLGSQLPAGEALRAAERWGGDKYIVFKRGNTPCLRTSIAGRNGSADARELAAALTRWATASGTAATVTQSDAMVTLTSCEPAGGTSPVSAPALARAFLYVSIRNGIVVNGLDGGLTVTASKCLADRLLALEAVAGAINSINSLNEEPPPGFETTIQQAAQSNAAAIRAQCPR